MCPRDGLTWMRCCSFYISRVQIFHLTRKISVPSTTKDGNKKPGRSKCRENSFPKHPGFSGEGLPLRSKKGHRIKNCRSDSMVFYVECSSFCILTQNNINSCQHLLFLTHIPCQTKLSWYILVYSVIGILQNYRILMKYPVFLPGLNTQI